MVNCLFPDKGKRTLNIGIGNYVRQLVEQPMIRLWHPCLQSSYDVLLVSSLLNFSFLFCWWRLFLFLRRTPGGRKAVSIIQSNCFKCPRWRPLPKVKNWSIFQSQLSQPPAIWVTSRHACLRHWGPIIEEQTRAIPLCLFWIPDPQSLWLKQKFSFTSISLKCVYYAAILLEYIENLYFL